MVEVRYMHTLAPRACGHVYTIMRGPLTADGGFDTDKTGFFEPDGVKCTCAEGGKRTPVDLHMLNPNEMAALGTSEKRGVEFVEVAIGMSKSDDDDDADGTPEIAEDLPFTEAKKPKAKPKRKPKVKKDPEPVDQHTGDEAAGPKPPVRSDSEATPAQKPPWPFGTGARDAAPDPEPKVDEKATEPMGPNSPPPSGPTEHGHYAAPWTPPVPGQPTDPEKATDSKPKDELPSSWPFGGPRDR